MDRPYDYKVPESLQGLEPGMRVIVPFGSGNRRTEGIILKISEETEERPLKCVDKALDTEPVLTQQQIQLALWMRDRFFCTVYDAVRAILPAGLWYQSKNTYRIARGVDREAAYDAAGKSKPASALLEVLFAHGGEAAESDVLIAMTEKDLSAAYRRLSAANVVERDIQEKRRIGDKTAAVAVLQLTAEEASELSAKKRASAPMQASVLEMLTLMGEAEVKEIRYFTGASQSTLKTMEKYGYIALERREVFRRPEYAAPADAGELILNESQQEVFQGLTRLIGGEKPEAALLYGVTGSGKTSVYIMLIKEIIKQGRQAIVLVPEIALTPQFVSVLTAHFGDGIAVLHSSLAIGERYDEWKRIRSGAVNVVVGTRSAVFAPLPELGLIIIDEEQERTYKSENSPRYHARDIAKYRCAHSNALLLMGSATPSVESMYNAERGKYRLFRMRKRYNKKPLPGVIAADMRREIKNGNGGSISSVLLEELKANIENGEQSILFINRRGASSLIICGECGYTYTCPNCSVSLTYHSANRRLMCHHCGYSQSAARQCPECGGLLKFSGAGTQKVEEELRELLPDTEVIRMDTDTVTPANSHEAILSRFRDEKIPILLGTQMVAKGLNFDNVTLVGVISADQYLYVNDYRAHERTFSMITQVVGRSGRGEKPGRAVIQSFTPANEVIQLAARQDYDGFYAREIELRRAMGCPPVADILKITASGQSEAAVLRCCTAVRDAFRGYFAGTEVQVIGPAPAAVAKVNNRYRYNVTLNGRNDRRMRDIVSSVVCEFSKNRDFRGVSVFADVDPMD